MPVIGYARVSTGDQSLAMQVDALRHAGCSRIYEEVASGSRRDRPVLIETLDHLIRGDTLVVWKLDRLARSLQHLIEVVEWLNHVGCGFRSITEAIDTTNPSGRLIFHIFGALAEFERSIIRERTLAGLQAARARGRKGGRPKAMDDQSLIVAEALLKDGLLSVREVAKQVGVSPATLYKYMPTPRTAVKALGSAR